MTYAEYCMNVTASEAQLAANCTEIVTWAKVTGMSTLTQQVTMDTFLWN